MELNNTLLKYQWVNNEIKAEIKNYLGASDNDNTAIQSPHDAARRLSEGGSVIQDFFKR